MRENFFYISLCLNNNNNLKIYFTDMRCTTLIEIAVIKILKRAI